MLIPQLETIRFDNCNNQLITPDQCQQTIFGNMPNSQNILGEF